LSDGVHFYYQDTDKIFVVEGTSSAPYFAATNGTVVHDYQFISAGKSLVITKHLDTKVTEMFLVDGSEKTPFSAIPFLSSDLFEWKVVYGDAGTLRGVLFYTTVATVYGYGFGDANNEVTLALDNPKEYVVVTLLAEDEGVEPSKSYLGIQQGSDQGYELISTIFWDYSNLVLPLRKNTTAVKFIFSDFIIALTRVKNEISTIFQSYIDLGDVSSIDNWSPDMWDEVNGMSLNITFTLGETEEKITSILTNMANEIGVTVERECEFQDFLQCDSLHVTHHFRRLGVQDDSTVTGGPGVVTFLVNGGLSLLPSVVSAMMLVILYSLV